MHLDIYLEALRTFSIFTLWWFPRRDIYGRRTRGYRYGHCFRSAYSDWSVRRSRRRGVLLLCLNLSVPNDLLLGIVEPERLLKKREILQSQISVPQIIRDFSHGPQLLAGGRIVVNVAVALERIVVRCSVNQLALPAQFEGFQVGWRAHVRRFPPRVGGAVDFHVFDERRGCKRARGGRGHFFFDFFVDQVAVLGFLYSLFGSYSCGRVVHR